MKLKYDEVTVKNVERALEKLKSNKALYDGASFWMERPFNDFSDEVSGGVFRNIFDLEGANGSNVFIKKYENLQDFFQKLNINSIEDIEEEDSISLGSAISSGKLNEKKPFYHVYNACKSIYTNNEDDAKIMIYNLISNGKMFHTYSYQEAVYDLQGNIGLMSSKKLWDKGLLVKFVLEVL